MKRLFPNHVCKLFCLFICFTYIINTSGQGDYQQLKDSLTKIIASAQGKEKLDAYYELISLDFPEEEMEGMLKYANDMIKEAQRQKDKDGERNARRKESAILYNHRRMDDFQKKVKEHLVFFKANDYQEDYYYHYQFLIVTYGTVGDKNRALSEAKKMYEEAKSENYLFGIAQATSLLARVYAIEKRFGEAEVFAYETLEMAKKILKNDNTNPDHHFLLFGTYADLVDVLIDLNKFDKISLLMPAWREQLTLYEKIFGHPEGLRLYYNFKTRIYSVTEEYDKAKIYCDSLEQMVLDLYTETCLWEYKSIIYENTKEYAKALYWLDKVMEKRSYGELEAAARDTKNKARILCKMGRGEEAWSLYEQAFLQNDSLHLNEYNEQLDDLRTQYEVDKHIAEKERNRNYFLFALGGCVLLAIALGIWISRHRAIVKKNRDLYRQIKEQDRLAEELEAISKQYEQMAQLMPEPPENPENIDDNDVGALRATPLPGNKQQRQLVSHLRELLLKERYFAKFDIDIQELIPEMATNRTYLYEALKAVAGRTPMEFLNYLRLDEAKHLLDTSNLTIETIAFECGFNTARTFYRQFRERYRITPTEYRRIAKTAR